MLDAQSSPQQGVTSSKSANPGSKANSATDLEPSGSSKPDGDGADPNGVAGRSLVPVPSAVLEKITEELTQGGVRRDRASPLARTVVSQVMAYHSGPLPTVGDFAGYEEICPGAARDILEMAKSDLAHRQRMDHNQMFGDIFLKALAMIIAASIVAILVGGAIYAAVAGHENVAIAIATGSGIATVIGVVARIYLGSKRQPPLPQTPGKKRRR
jgi:uncharacterized membrane protein